MPIFPEMELGSCELTFKLLLPQMGPLRTTGKVWNGGLQCRTSKYPLSRLVPLPRTVLYMHVRHVGTSLFTFKLLCNEVYIWILLGHPVKHIDITANLKSYTLYLGSSIGLFQIKTDQPLKRVFFVSWKNSGIPKQDWKVEGNSKSNCCIISLEILTFYTKSSWSFMILDGRSQESVIFSPWKSGIDRYRGC